MASSATPTGIVIPVGTDVFDPDGDMGELAGSLAPRVIVPVANATDRDQRVTALTALGAGPTPARPLFVDREDLGVIERTTDGTTWHRMTSFAAASGIATFPTAVAATHLGDIILPAGVFTLPPILTATLVASAQTTGVILDVWSVTTTAARMSMVIPSGATFSSTGRVVHWHAIQATSGSATG